MRHSAPPRRRTCALALLFALAAAAPVASAQAQTRGAPTGWRVSAEAGAGFGARWLEGPDVPRVSSGTAFMFAAGIQRALTAATSAGAALRVSLQPLDLRENGAGWSGGTLTEYDLLALLSYRLPGSVETNLEVGAGAALLTGARDIVPFSGMGTVAPAGETAIVVTLPGAFFGQRDVGLVARYGAVRASAESALGGTAGWVGRASAGVRITQ